MSTDKPTALVVGVGPGLGSALVRLLATHGLNVVAVARGASQRGRLQVADGGKVHPYDADITDPAAVGELFTWLGQSMPGPLALTVFNAGTLRLGSVLDISPEDFEQCWRVGCFGGFLVGRAAAAVMREQGHGTLIFTGATASLRGGAGFVNLAAPKFGLRAVAQSMARELAPAGVHVAHVILDGQIQAPRNEALLEQNGPDSLLDADAIAANYWHLHCQPRNAWTHELDLRPWVEKF